MPTRTFFVPTSIGRHDRRHFRRYHQGRVYHGGHHHHHDVYLFPVATPEGRIWQRHDYCDGHHLSGGQIAYRGERVSFGVRF
ncbi:MAG: hypothetical protein GWO04_10055 [Actinobacteria bacterium]|nr:hypothetical protein [Actinomycetota bacterium]NIV86483.1 hypothetical protein [Actinomycetota bacterium]